MQHDHVLKKLNNDVLTPSPGSGGRGGGGGGGGLQAKYLLPSCYILDSLIFDMQHGHV